MSTNRTRTRWAAIGAAVAVTLGAAGIGGYNLVSADISSGDRPVFVPINPCRLADTRPDPNNVGPRKAPLAATETLTLTAHGDNGECIGASSIPTDALALSLNVTALGASELTFLTFWGDGDNPGTANLNPSPGQPPTPNAVNTPLSGAGTFNVFNASGSVDVVIDVNGYYAHHDHDDRYYTQSQVNALVAPETSVIVFGPDFVPIANSFAFSRNLGLYEFAGGGSTCAEAPVRLPVGATITGVDIRYLSSGPAGLDVGVIGLPMADAATFDLSTINVPVDESNVALSSGSTMVQSATVPPEEGATAILDGFVYNVRLCSSDSPSIIAVVIDLDLG